MSRPLRRFLVRLLIAAGVLACGDETGPLLDRSAPVVDGVVLAHDRTTVVLPAAQTYAAGEPVWMLLDVSDERRVGWIGFHVTGPIDQSDSVAVPDSLQRLQVLVGMDLGGLSGLVEVRGFAIDGSGNRTESVVAGNPVSVYAPVVLPVVAVPLEGPVSDFTYDMKREQLLLADPGQARIAVYSLIAGAFGPAIVAPAPAGAIDLTASGDSLVAFFPETAELGVRSLVSPSAWDLVTLSETVAGLDAPALAVSAAGTVVIAAGQVVEYDLATGLETHRTDGGLSGALPAAAALASFEGRTRIVLTFEDGAGGTLGQVYQSATDTFSAARPLGALEAVIPSSDAAGRVLVGASLFGPLLDPIRRFHPPGLGRAGVVSNTGEYAYFAYGTGYLRTRITDGVTLEQVLLPEPPHRLGMIPGDPERVIAIGSGTLTIVVDAAPGAPPVSLIGDGQKAMNTFLTGARR